MSRSEYFNYIYSILVVFAGAHESERSSFVDYHLKGYDWKEWRFQGNLGFGGKYYERENRVSCYREDEDEKRKEIIREVNKRLQELGEY